MVLVWGNLIRDIEISGTEIVLIKEITTEVDGAISTMVCGVPGAK